LRRSKKEREKMNNEQITITKATAQRALDRLADWLEWVEDLDKETRADILALDELIKALDAEDNFQEKIERNRQRARELNASYQASTQAVSE
jgi:hypothetical protein